MTIDAQGKNLLFLLFESLAQGSNNGLNARALEIADILVNKYKLDILKSDIKGRNIMHVIGSSNNIELFKLVLDWLNVNDRRKLLEQKDKVREATPLVDIVKLVFLKENTFSDKRLELKDADLTYIETCKDEEKLEPEADGELYFLKDRSFPFEENEKSFKSHALHLLLRRCYKGKFTTQQLI